MDERTLGARLFAAARSDCAVTFVDSSEHELRLTYAELWDRARNFAGGLQLLGVCPGDRVALILPTGPGFYDAFFGTILAGAVPVPLYPPVRLGRLDEYHRRSGNMLRACGARMLLTDRRIRRLLGTSIKHARPPLGCVPLEGVRPQTPRPVARAADDLALIQFSSGTTAIPKPVRLTHKQILANVEALLQSILDVYPEGTERTHVGVSWLPLYHDMGLIGAMLSAVDHPGDLVLIPPEVFVARPSLWLRAVSRHRGTISPAPNFAYSLCAERIRPCEIEGVDLSSWLVALNGAEPVTPAALDHFVERFAGYGLRASALTPVYGLAEATLAVTFSDLGGHFRRSCFDRDALLHGGVAKVAAEGQQLVSVGRPLPGFAVRIVDGDGWQVASGRLGRVEVRGPSIMDGYDRLPEATAAVVHDGWLDTGDTGFFYEGELYLYGRAKDLIVLKGLNYAPQDIEQVLDDLGAIRTGCTAAVGVVRDNATAEELLLFVERARGERREGETIAEEAARHVTMRTGLVASQVVVLDPGTLPRTSSGKIRRAETRRLFLAGELRPPQRMNLVRVAAEMVRSQVGFARSRLPR